MNLALLELNSDINWICSDPIVKGFFFQLLILSKDGLVTNKDNELRKIFNLPVKWSKKQKENISIDDKKDYLNKIFNENSNISSIMLEGLESIFNDDTIDNKEEKSRYSYEQWVDYLWTNKWKPQLLMLWHEITPELISKYDFLKNKKNFLFNEIAYKLSLENNENLSHTVVNSPKETVVKINKKVSRKKIPDLRPIMDVEDLFIFNDIDAYANLWLTGSNDVFEDEVRVLRLWRIPVSVNTRKSMWEVGVSILTNGVVSEQSKARAFIGKMRNKYGEVALANAISTLSLRANLPQNRYAFLTTLLTNMEEGTPEERKAREQRANLAL